MKKKFMAIAVALMLALSCVFFASCGNNSGNVTPDSEIGNEQGGDDKDNDNNGKEDGDKEDGASKITVYTISNALYASIEDAVKGYLENELSDVIISVDDIVGGFGSHVPSARETFPAKENTLTATYVSHENKCGVKVEDFGFVDTQKEGLISVEKILVTAMLTFESNDIAPLALELKESVAYPKEITQTVYVAKYDDMHYEYVVTAPEQGESITNTVLRAVVSLDAYANCEMTILSESTRDGVNWEFTEGERFKFTLDCMYWAYFYTESHFKSGVPAYNPDSPNVPDEHDSEEYFFMREKECVQYFINYYKANAHWEKGVPEDWFASVADYRKYSLSWCSRLGSVSQYPAAMYTAVENGFSFELNEESNRSTQTVVTVENGKIADIYLLNWDDGDIYRSHIVFENFGNVTVKLPTEISAA